jgi:F420-0:gamma-glutamyl ligase
MLPPRPAELAVPQLSRNLEIMSRERVSVLINDGHLGKMGSVVEALRKAGLKVEQKLASTGVITGTIESGKRPQLQSVAGVDAVEVEREFVLPPPSSAVQ